MNHVFIFFLHKLMILVKNINLLKIFYLGLASVNYDHFKPKNEIEYLA